MIHFHIKSISPWKTFFCVNSFWQVFNCFLRTAKLVLKRFCQFVTLISVKWFHMFTHFDAASFSRKMFFMKLSTFYVSSTRHIFTHLSAVSERSLKKVRSSWTLFIILLTSVVICKQKLFAWKRDCATSCNLQML